MAGNPDQIKLQGLMAQKDWAQAWSLLLEMMRTLGRAVVDQDRTVWGGQAKDEAEIKKECQILSDILITLIANKEAVLDQAH